MNIDLSKVIGYSKDSLQSRALMRSIMLDLYPDDTLEMNVLLDVFESGVPKVIKSAGRITDGQYAVYIKMIADAYGLKEQYIMEGLDAWIDQCLGPGASLDINKPIIGTTSSGIKYSETASVEEIPQEDIPTITKGHQTTTDSDYDDGTKNETSSFRFPFFRKRQERNASENHIENLPDETKSSYEERPAIPKPVIEDRNNSPKPVVDTNGQVSDYEISRVQGDVNSVIITKFRGFDGKKIIVPNKIGTKRVIGVGEAAYQNCKEVQVLVVSEGIQFIENSAFAGCSNLSSISLPNTLKSIGTLRKKSFDYDIDHMNVDDLLDTIKEDAERGALGAFSGTAIRNIVLPQNLSHLGRATFLDCNNLEKVEFKGRIRKIEDHTFSRCKALKEFSIPNGVEEIGTYAFCASLIAKISFPQSLRVIERYAFLNCPILTSVQLPEGLQEIQAYAFSTSSLREITIPKTVTKIDKKAFGNVRNRDLTIYCYAGTEALSYARREGIQFKNAANRTS